MTSWHHLDWLTLTSSYELLQALHTQCALCHASLCILNDGQGCSVQTCQQRPSICCTQMPSYSVPPRGGWQLFQYFHLVWDTRGRWLHPTLTEMLGHLKASPKCRPCRPTIAWVMPFSYSGRNIHGAASMTALRSSFSHGPLPQSHEWGIWMVSLFDLEQLVSLDPHLVYFKGVVVFPLCLDDFIVAPPNSMVTITNPPQLALIPEAPFRNPARGPYFLPELLVGRYDSHLDSIWTCEAIPSCTLGTSVSSTPHKF